MTRGSDPGRFGLGYAKQMALLAESGHYALRRWPARIYAHGVGEAGALAGKVELPILAPGQGEVGVAEGAGIAAGLDLFG